MTTERMKAAEAGLVRFEGNPCRKGHGTARYTLTGVCVVCARENSVRQQRKMRERVRQLKASAQGATGGALSQD
jgi:hypothetical protein